MKKKTEAQGDFVQVEKTQNKQEVKKAKKKDKKPGFFKRMGAKIKDVFSELKKVNWPTFGKVVKQTGVVIVVVLIFLVVITAFDYGLLNLLKLISPNIR
ncbi:MAG: preprotein translocase subunit SecE [Clostridiales bacterium]|nr:preprotein translocase subunit SecE [Clostridiales bacterium]